MNEKTTHIIQQDVMADVFRDMPLRLDSKFSDHKCNEPIVIYEGDFRLELDNHVCYIIGEIFLQWLPYPNIILHVSDCNEDSTIDFLTLTTIYGWFTVYYDDIAIAKAIRKDMSIGTKNRLSYLLKECVEYQDICKVDKVSFIIPNLRSFHGETVRDNPDQYSASKSRLKLQGDDHTVTLDKRKDHKHTMKDCQNITGYGLSFDGMIEFDEPKDYEYVMDFIWKLSVYLTFLNGKRTTAFHIEGWAGKNRVFLNFREPAVSRSEVLKSWPSAFDSTGLSDLWNEIYRRCNDDDEFDVIRTIVHLYTDSNSNAFLETGLILNQTIIELIYNFYIAEKTLVGQELDDAYWNKAIKKMKNLHKISKFKNSLLEGFPELKSYLQSKGLYHLTFYARVRNALVHSKKIDREFYNDIPMVIKVQLHNFGLLFIETTLLMIYDVNVKIKNRKSGGWVGGDEMWMLYNYQNNKISL